jgi:hypothetical protein
LALGQRLQVGYQRRQPIASFQDVGCRRVRRFELVCQNHGGLAPAQDRDGLVVSYPEQPRPHGKVALLGAQRHERARHRALQCVLRIVLVAHDRPAVAIERLMVALIQHGIRPHAALRCEPREPLVARKSSGESKFGRTADRERKFVHRPPSNNVADELRLGRSHVAYRPLLDV